MAAVDEYEIVGRLTVQRDPVLKPRCDYFRFSVGLLSRGFSPLPRNGCGTCLSAASFSQQPE